MLSDLICDPFGIGKDEKEVFEWLIYVRIAMIRGGNLGL